MIERHLRVARTARFYTLGESGAAVRELWIACHGYAQLAGRFIRHFSAIDDGTRLIAAPEALNRFYIDDVMGPHGPASKVGATWMTREDRLTEIDDYVVYLDALCGQLLHEIAGVVAGVRIVALGFSQGTATIARWAARTTHPIARVILWGAGLPPELDPSPALFRGARLTLVYGDEDRMAAADRLAAERNRLEAGVMPFEFVRFAGGHRMDGEMLKRLAVDDAAV